ncbi:secretogranin-1 isoform X2 [Poecile atricapillus]|uniref:secretogranin-1 isoform X2 n=1 Tax=Poecile atricapillus TaxID=48891 RepID=UPI0027389EDE|nr:secretogranin-1 isoform X2 [Poecile atricapillus]
MQSFEKFAPLTIRSAAVSSSVRCLFPVDHGYDCPWLPQGASAAPVEKDHTEEMVTRCIVEVLSNALSKPNAPPINPECKEILKKSDKDDRERSENIQPEVRHPKDPAETEKHPAGSVEKEQRQAEEESKTYMEGGDEEKLTREEGKSKEEEAGHHTPAQDETLHTEEKKHYQEIGREEGRNYHSEEESKEGKCCEDVEAAVLTKKSHSEGMSMDELRGGNDQSPRGHWHLEEGVQSPYKQIREGEEGEEERSEKYHHESQERGFSHQQEREESEESEEREERKEPYKPKGYHGKHRAGDSYEEKRGRGGERGEPAGGSHPGEANLWEQWKHRQKHQEESEEKGGSAGRRGPEELQEERPAGQGSEEHRDSWQQSQESREEENKRHHHSEESEEKWREERRHHDGSRRSEGRMYLADENEEGLDRILSKEKQRRVGGRPRLRSREEEGSQKTHAREHQGQARRHYSTEDSLEEEEVVEKKHHSSDQVENEEEERFAEREEYRGHLPAEKEKRTAASYRPFYPLLWWKSRHLDKRDGAGEQLLEGREEGRPTLSEKSLFPEYNDYEWWSEKQIQSALNQRRTEKRNPGKTNGYGVERQYNKMDQLAQLLNYRKKSAELPELYSSGEDLKKRHVAGNDRRSRSQRPLTEEEEKQLENLATMDLELQNIAEKINSLRRG